MLLLAIVVVLAIWLALVLFKWLLILAVIAAAVWLIMVWRRRLAH